MLTAALLLAALVQAGDAAPKTNLGPPVDNGQAGVSQPTQEPSALAPMRVPAGAEIQVELTETLDSTTSHLGDKFPLRLAEAIVLNGQVVIPAGAAGQGEVIDVGRAGFGGRQGKLILSARFLDISGHHIRIRGLSLRPIGDSHVDLATGAMFVVSVAPLFINGGDVNVPLGTRATAKLAEDLNLPPVATTPDTGKQQ